MHGISYRYILKKMSSVLNKPKEKLNLIVCHLGNGASVCGIKNGASVITSMGLTPLEGLMMGTRSGDVDPSLGDYICNKLNMSGAEYVQILNKKSGLLAMSGISSDARNIEIEAAKGNKRAEMTIQMFVNRVCKYISYYQNEVGNKLDGLVFTGGIGENSVEFRRKVFAKLRTLDLKLDSSQNAAVYEDYNLISETNSEIAVYAVRTDEEIMMCTDVDDLVLQNK